MGYSCSQKLYNSYCNYCRFIDPYDAGIDDEMQSIFRCYCRASNCYVPIYTSSDRCDMFVYYPLSNACGFDKSESVYDFERGLSARKQLRREVMVEMWRRYENLLKERYPNELYE